MTMVIGWVWLVWNELLGGNGRLASHLGSYHLCTIQIMHL